jgi:C1A family cysteine protease
MTFISINFAQAERLSSAPLNPNFIKYTQNPSRNFFQNPTVDGHILGFDNRECEGGNYFMTTAYLARWNGPVDEVDAPYPYISMATPRVAVKKHVQDVWFIPDRAAPGKDYNTTVKTAIKSYGAVSVYFQWEDSGYNEANAAYYTTKTGGQSCGCHYRLG